MKKLFWLTIVVVLVGFLSPAAAEAESYPNETWNDLVPHSLSGYRAYTASGRLIDAYREIFCRKGDNRYIVRISTNDGIHTTIYVVVELQPYRRYYKRDDGTRYFIRFAKKVELPDIKPKTFFGRELWKKIEEAFWR